MTRTRHTSVRARNDVRCLGPDITMLELGIIISHDLDHTHQC